MSNVIPFPRAHFVAGASYGHGERVIIWQGTDFFCEDAADLGAEFFVDYVDATGSRTIGVWSGPSYDEAVKAALSWNLPIEEVQP